MRLAPSPYNTKLKLPKLTLCLGQDRYPGDDSSEITEKNQNENNSGMNREQQCRKNSLRYTCFNMNASNGKELMEWS